MKRIIDITKQMGSVLVSAWGAIGKSAKSAGGLVACLVEVHKAVRRLLVLWSAGLITYATIRVYETPMSEMNAAGVSMYATTVGILTTVLAIYQLQRGKEQKPPVQSGS